jgi:hypothetical protein
MSRDEEEVMFNLGEGCMVHGDEYMRECRMCGVEFCAKCAPGTVCPDCAENQDDDLDEGTEDEGEGEADEEGEDAADEDEEE